MNSKKRTWKDRLVESLIFFTIMFLLGFLRRCL